jgi:hypothetical protein
MMITAKDLPIYISPTLYRLTIPGGKSRNFSRSKWTIKEVRLFRDGVMYAMNQS